MKKTTGLLSSFLALAAAASLYAAIPVPTGVFYFPSQQSIDPTVVALPQVDGVVIGASWNDLQPTETGPLNTSTLTTALNIVEPTGKPMRLAILTGGPGAGGDGPGTSAGAKPDWLITKIHNNGGKFYTYHDSTTTTATIPVFWDPTLLAAHAALVQAVANFIQAGHPLVRIVFVPYANANTNDWNLGDLSTQNDGIIDPATGHNSSPRDRWLHTVTGSGYATMADALIGAGEATYDAYGTYFSQGQITTTSIGRLQDPLLNPNDTTGVGRNIAAAVTAYAVLHYPGRVVLQKNNLNGGGLVAGNQGGVPPYPGTGNAWNDLAVLSGANNVPTAAQMVYHAWKDERCKGAPGDPYDYLAKRMNAGTSSDCLDSTLMLHNAVDVGASYGTKWQEIYELDIQNLGTGNMDPETDVPKDVIGYAHGLLYQPDPVALTDVVSRQSHGTAGSFDIDLLAGNGIESRKPASATYQLVFTFTNNLTHVGGATVTGGTVNSFTYTPGSNQCTVNLTGLTNAQYHTVTFTDVTDAVGEHSDTFATPPWGLLLGDVTVDGGVFSNDVSQVRNAIGQAVTASNFRDDVTVDGIISNADVNAVTPYKQTQLP